jgi:hypothetical protein
MKILGYKVVHFLHIGKTGGTAIKNAFLEKDVLFRKMRIFNKRLFVLHKHDFHLDHVGNNEYVFFVIRDPVERFVSGFNSRLRQGLPRKFNPWTVKERQVFEYFDTPNKLAEALTNGDEEIREKAEQAMGTILHVRNTVWEWFIDEKYFLENKSKILCIMKQSNLEQDFHLFKQKMGIKIGELPSDNIKSHKSPVDVDKRLTNIAFTNLQQWYRRDYEFLQFLNREGFVN